MKQKITLIKCSFTFSDESFVLWESTQQKGIFQVGVRLPSKKGFYVENFQVNATPSPAASKRFIKNAYDAYELQSR